MAPEEAIGGYLGIRPEDIELRFNLTDGLPGLVVSDEYLGADTIAHVTVGNHRVKVRMSGKHSLAGQPCRLYWTRENAHVFGADGLRRDDLTPTSLPRSLRSIPRPPAVGSFQH